MPRPCARDASRCGADGVRASVSTSSTACRRGSWQADAATAAPTRPAVTEPSAQQPLEVGEVAQPAVGAGLLEPGGVHVPARGQPAVAEQDEQGERGHGARPSAGHQNRK